MLVVPVDIWDRCVTLQGEVLQSTEDTDREIEGEDVKVVTDCDGDIDQAGLAEHVYLQGQSITESNIRIPFFTKYSPTEVKLVA